MRVTSNSFTSSLVDQLNRLAGRQYKLQNQVATGQRIQAPEDDPAAVQRTLSLSVEAGAVRQFTNNIALLRERATTAFDALKAVKTISDRAGEIATLADGTKSPDELRIYATEVTQLIQQVAQVLNGKQRGDYLFGGTASGQSPFTVTTDANGNVTGVTYHGNTNVAEADIATGVGLSVDVPGANNTGSGARGLVSDSRTGADFFNHLIALQNNLLAGDTGAIAATDLAALRSDEDNFLHHIGNNGAVQMWLETAATVASARSLSLDQMISKEADADIAETLVQFNQAQYAYQAVLQSGAGIMGRSLLDFLQ